MSITEGILLIVTGYVIWLLYEFHTPTNVFIKSFIKKFPKISFLLGAILIVVIYNLVTPQSSHSLKEKPGDCEYDAYHGWICN